MEEVGKKRLVIALAALAGLAYFFICAAPLPKELGLEPAWSRPVPAPAAELPSVPAFSGGESGAGLKLHSFRLASFFGYFNEAGSAIASATIPFNAAVSDKGYIVYEKDPSALLLRTPDGKDATKIAEQGYPFFGGGRLFVMHPGQSSVSEIDGAGRVVWRRDFVSIVTAFDASPGLALFGLMDGHLVGLAPDGKVLLDFVPGGSRIDGIYGCAVSPDGLMAAAICGLDKQRLVVLEKRSSAFRVTWHRYLSSDYRRPVSMAFTENGRYLLHESPGGLGIYDKTSRGDAFVTTQSLSGIGLFSASRNMFLAIEGSDAAKSLVCIGPEGHREFSLAFAGDSAFATLSGDAVFLGIAAADGSSRLVRLDFKEE